MRIWVTKYALSSGIAAKDGFEVCRDINEQMVSGFEGSYRVCYHKGEWHETEEAAKAQAEKMRLAKIASLKKQIAKLEKLEF